MTESAEPRVTAEPGAAADISREELQLATRNHGFPLEALRYAITPVGLHYLLIHYDIPAVDPARWRLEIGGHTERSLSLSLDDLNARPAVTRPVTLECAGNGRARLTPRPVSQPWLTEAVGTAEWTGVPLRSLLDEIGVASDALEVVCSGLDRGIEGGVEQRYQRSLPLAEAMLDEVLVAYQMNGQPLPPQHGYPARLVVPGWYGMASVKWLARIEVVAAPFTGYQQAWAYRFRQHEDEAGEPVTRIMPRALMVAPGIPDFMTRERTVSPGRHVVEGRAWSGWGPIERVEVSTDGGERWQDTELGPPPAAHAWQAWRWTWDVEPGEHLLCCRATDAAGNTQPSEHNWNLGGYAVTTIQRVPVVCHPS